MRVHSILVLLTSLSIAAACGDEPTADASDEPVLEQAAPVAPTAPTAPTASTQPAPTTPAPRGDWVAGDYPPGLTSPNFLTLTGVQGQGNRARGYKVHVPKGYDPAKPAPVLFALHGFMQNALLFPVGSGGWVQKSDQEGFVLVMPNGVQEDAFGLGGSWNAGVCCGVAAAQRLDDVAFVRAIFAELQKHLNVDVQRVYATGMSNGGFMSYRLACEAADLFAAVAPVAGAIGTRAIAGALTNPNTDFVRCAPSKKIAVLAVHGEADGIVAYAGMKPSLEHLAMANGCAATTRAAAQPESRGDATCVTYEGCSGVEVTGCSVKGGGHCWFGDASCGTGAPGIGNIFVGNNSTAINVTDAVWSFVSRFRRD